MAGRKHAPEKREERAAADYYRLNTQAVEDLVTADRSNSPKVSRDELNKYRSGPKIRLGDWVKAFLIKWWFAGAVCFFFLWGLGTVVSNWENQLLIVGAALGLVTDLLVNNIFRFYAKTQGENDQWMMFPRKRYASLPLNLIYAFVILFCVVGTYNTVNAAWIAAAGLRDTIPLGVGPIMFGLFCAGWDMIFLGIKRVLKKVMADAKKSASAPSGKPTKSTKTGETHAGND